MDKPLSSRIVFENVWRKDLGELKREVVTIWKQYNAGVEEAMAEERTRQIVAKTKLPLGILIDKEFQEIERVFIPIFKSEDAFLIDYAQKLINNNNSKIVILDVNNHVQNNFVLQSAVNSLEQNHANNIEVVSEKTVSLAFLEKQDLMLISLESWKTLLDSDSDWLIGVPSVLILKS